MSPNLTTPTQSVNKIMAFISQDEWLMSHKFFNQLKGKHMSKIAYLSLERHAHESSFYIVPRYIRRLSGMTLEILDVAELIYTSWNLGFSSKLSNQEIGLLTNLTTEEVENALIFLESHQIFDRKKIDGKNFLVQRNNLGNTNESL